MEIVYKCNNQVRVLIVQWNFCLKTTALNTYNTTNVINKKYFNDSRDDLSSQKNQMGVEKCLQGFKYHRIGAQWPGDRSKKFGVTYKSPQSHLKTCDLRTNLTTPYNYWGDHFMPAGSSSYRKNQAATMQSPHVFSRETAQCSYV